MTRSGETRIGDTPRTLEQRLAEWQQQPGAYISEFEHYFINRMRDAARNGVGYGWMQQVIEWEWQSKGLGALGPEHSYKEARNLERLLAEAVGALEHYADEWHWHKDQYQAGENGASVACAALARIKAAKEQI